MRTKELEVQYNISRYEREKKRADVEAKRCRNFESQIQTFTKTEADLRSQLNVYVDKFKQVRRRHGPLLGTANNVSRCRTTSVGPLTQGRK